MRPASRAVVVLALLAAAGLFYWTSRSNPVDTTLTFVLSDLEIAHDGELLRYEAIRLLQCTVVDSEGQEVAQISHRRPGAVATPPPLRLPPGDYTLRITLTVAKPDQGSFTKRFLKQSGLRGDKVTVRL